MNKGITFQRILAYLLVISFLAPIWGCTTGEKQEKGYNSKTQTDKNGNSYRYVTNDPYDARIYELDNGLKVYLTVDKEEPRIQTLIGVRAGSASEQRETTGLAHYLEHMLFKGSSRMGTMNWEKEKAYLEKISDLYEKRKNTDDSAKKRQIYHQIDSLSQEAAQYAIPNEYDKIVSDLGANRTNAFTSKDRTVYMNNIPANELEKWVKLERERFGDMVLRLFHTELETVFEEYNTNQDSDFRRATDVMNKTLFKGHPYQLSTIGKPEHLKNPSMKNVHAFKDEYYVPNNMAICLSGDMDPAETFQTIKEYWGDMESNEDLAEDRDHGEAEPIDGPVEKSVQGPEAERVYIGYRFPANDTAEKMVTLIDELLYNNQAGLIDLNLVKEQKILDGGCYSNFYREYGQLRFYGQARSDQELSEVKALLLDQVENIKKGDFPDWMLEAVIRNKKRERIEDRSSNQKAFSFTNAFIKGEPWIEHVKYLDELEAITKEDLVEFAQKHLNEDRVVVYKRQGEDTSAVKMPKPPITSVNINRNQKSEFRQEIESMESGRIDPVFLDYEERITKRELAPGVDLNYIENQENELFSLYYLVDVGSHHDRELSLALDYLEKLGTEEYSPSALEQEFYKLAADFSVSTNDKRSYVKIKGLKENFTETVELLEHLLNNVQADTAAYRKLADNQIEERRNRKKSQQWNLRAMINYGIYGPNSPFTNQIPADSLRMMDPNHLVDKVHNLFDHEHYLFYHGTRNPDSVKAKMAGIHEVSEDLKPLPSRKTYAMRDTEGDQVFQVDYDMVQAMVALVGKGQEQNPELFPYAKMYNNYYGRGLSSVMFQEIRESKGLAYGVSSSFTTPDTGRHHNTFTFMGIQSDKLETATDEVVKLLNNMTEAQEQFEASKSNILKNIETDRTTGTSIFFSYLSDKQKGFDEDRDKVVYNEVKDMTLADFRAFFNEQIKGNQYDVLVMGNPENLDKDTLRKYGNIKKLSRDVLFGYEVGEGFAMNP